MDTNIPLWRFGIYIQRILQIILILHLDLDSNTISFPTLTFSR